MEERRKYKRLKLNVSLELERLDTQEITTLKYAHVHVLDISKTGIGFMSRQKLEKDGMYNTKLEIWNGEIIDTVIKIVRTEEREDEEYVYGGLFVGMTDKNALKIEIYRLFHEALEESKNLPQEEEEQD